MNKYLSEFILLIFLVTGFPGHAEDSFRVDATTDPMQWAVGPNGRVDFLLTNDWSVGPAFSYQNRMVLAVHVNEFGPGLYISRSFGRSKTHGWYLDAGAFYGVLRAEYSDSNGKTDSIKVGNWTERLLVGHHWYFGHFSLDVGVGDEVNSAGHAKIRDANGNEVVDVPIAPSRAVIETSIGLAF